MNQHSTLSSTLLDRAQTDLIKGWAIIAIFFLHYMHKIYGLQSNIQWIFDETLLTNFTYAVKLSKIGPVALLFAYFGYIGVTAFFILSGYGLAASRLKNEDAPWKSFFIKRALRLLPLYYLSIIVFTPIITILYNPPIDRVWETVLYKTLLIHTFNPNTMLYINSPLWFIGVLVWLYVCFPLLYFMVRRNSHMTLATGLAIAYASSSLIASSWIGKAHVAFAMGGFPLSRLGEFTVGIWLAMMLRRDPQKAETVMRHPATIASSAGIFALGVAGLMYSPLYPLHPLFLALPLMHATTLGYTLIGRAAEKVFSPIRFTGRHAFALFILHEPLLILMSPWLKMFSMPLLSGILLVLPLFVLLSALADQAMCRVIRLKP